MSNNAILAALRRVGIGKEEMTGHGFRAMARTILDEVLGFRPDFIEHQLAHAVRGLASSIGSRWIGSSRWLPGPAFANSLGGGAGRKDGVFSQRWMACWGVESSMGSLR